MNSLSPSQYGNISGESEYNSNNSENGKSGLNLSLGFLKTLTEKKSTRVDGQPSKRRGPKPDSKPALTRRQELNRQAQRTHRERKELYIKALEQEVIRLKESFSQCARDKDTLAEENMQLKQLLANHGINWQGTGGVDELTSNLSGDFTPGGSLSGSYAPGSTSFSPSPGANLDKSSPGNGISLGQQQVQQGVDYDQAGIDFVLTLERPCMVHLDFMVDRTQQPDSEICGHTLMATCAPEPHPSVEIPFGHSLGKRTTGTTWDLNPGSLATLLDLSRRIDLDGEVTPVMAWGMILGHPRLSELTREDFAKLTEDLSTKSRCYGFGAVMEEFEVRDALMKVFYTKAEMMPNPQFEVSNLPRVMAGYA